MLRHLLRRNSTPSSHVSHPFRWRGEGVSRIEGLSDTVFGFAITLLVVSLEVPKNVADLMEAARAFIPFVVSFFALFSIWRAQFQFFRRYGLEDDRTVWLTGMLLVFVLFAIYPLKFLFTVFGMAIVDGTGAASLKVALPIESIPKVLGLYAFGFLGISTAFSLLYHHAWTQREKLGLTEIELHDTRSMQLRWRRGILVGVILLAWCTVLLCIPGHVRARDNVFEAVYIGGCLAVIGTALTQALQRKAHARERHALAHRARSASDATSSGWTGETHDRAR